MMRSLICSDRAARAMFPLAHLRGVLYQLALDRVDGALQAAAGRGCRSRPRSAASAAGGGRESPRRCSAAPPVRCRFSSSRTLPGSVAHQACRSRGRDALDVLVIVATVPGDEVVRQQQQVGLAFAQRWDVDREYVEPVVEVGPELLRSINSSRLRLVAAMTRTSLRWVVFAPTPLELPFLEYRNALPGWSRTGRRSRPETGSRRGPARTAPCASPRRR